MEAVMDRKSRTKLGTGMLVLAMIVAGGTLSTASEAPDDESQKNVLLLVRIVQMEGANRLPIKTYSLVVADGSPGSKLLAGARVPFPTEVPGTEKGSGDLTGMGIAYQNIGFSTNARAWIVGEDKIRVMADIEDSQVVPGAEGAPPMVETRQMSVNAVLTDRTPLELTRAEGQGGRTAFVEVEARILP
jgi:hypothetical protein